ncbi:MAG: P27 family phage terminase small subunit [Planctomycetota bacterium]
MGEGRKKWEMLVPQLKDMGVLATVDRDQLALYCKIYGEWRELGKLFEEQIRYTRNHEEKQLLRSGMYMTEKGNYAYHPLKEKGQ